MKTLVIANEKGGVGKSSLTVHIAHAAQEKGMRVLLTDMDRQGSLGLSFPAKDKGEHLTASALYQEKTLFDMSALESLGDGLAIIRADAALLDVDLGGIAVVANPRANLAAFAKNFDLCLIDTPPTLGPRLVASLVAADHVVTPVSMGLYEMAGVRELINTIMAIRQKFNRRLNYMGVLPMKINLRRQSEQKQLKMLEEELGDKMLKTYLPERAAVRNAVEAGRPVWENARGESHGKAAAEWRAACDLIIANATK